MPILASFRGSWSVRVISRSLFRGATIHFFQDRQDRVKSVRIYEMRSLISTRQNFAFQTSKESGETKSGASQERVK